MLLNNLLEKYASLFRPELEYLNTSTAKLFVDSHIKPRFFKLCLVPYLLRKKVEKEIQRLLQSTKYFDSSHLF